MGFLETDDLMTIDYNNDVDCHNDTQPNDLNNEIDKINLKKTSTMQKAARKLLKNIKN